MKQQKNSSKKMNIIMIGDTTLDHIVKHIQIHLEDSRIQTSGFNTWLTDAIDSKSVLYNNAPDVICLVLSPRFLELNDCESMLRLFLNSIQSVFFGATKLFVTLFFCDPNCIQKTYTSVQNQKKTNQLNQILFEFKERVENIDKVYLLDLPGLVIENGLQAIHDIRYEIIGRMYFSPKGAKKVGDMLVRHLSILQKPTKKVLAIDLDNTLWGGILGEDGVGGINIGTDTAGYPFHKFQKCLLELKKNGILLVILSKNNESDVLTVFNNHPDMVLKISDFVGYRINWQMKSENLKEIARELSLGIDSFVFFDDSSFERSQMSELCNEVTVIDVPINPELYCDALSAFTGFDVLTLTNEDKTRNDLYRTENERKTLRANAHTPDDFLISLEMKAFMEPFSDNNCERVIQLIQKTNQFNFSTKRYNSKELWDLTRSGFQIFAIRFTDRIGESGLVGVLIFSVESDSIIVDSFLLSCRVIGRSLEYAIFNHLLLISERMNLKKIIFKFINTEKNQPAKDFISTLNFEKIIDTDFWKKDLSIAENIPKTYVSLDLKEVQR